MGINKVILEHSQTVVTCPEASCQNLVAAFVSAVHVHSVVTAEFVSNS